MSLLQIRGLRKSFKGREVLQGIDLDIAAGEFVTILGESGSGKTTLLRIVAGFEKAEAGEVLMSGERLDLLPPFKRRVNTVFQHYALFPHLSVFENVAYGLRVKGEAASEIPARVERALAQVRMESFIRSAPTKLSGGQQQRVALARALVNKPLLLLLDEPLSALDANLRRQMQVELKNLQRELGITFIFVTHDQEEAMALSDRIVLLRNGVVEQVASPQEIYARPATAYAAEFIGQSNLLRPRVSGSRVEWGPLHWDLGPSHGAGREMGATVERSFSLRPEDIRLSKSGARGESEGHVHFRARLLNRSFEGSTELLEVRGPDGKGLRVRIPAASALPQDLDLEFAARDVVAVRDEGAGH